MRLGLVFLVIADTMVTLSGNTGGNTGNGVFLRVLGQILPDKDVADPVMVVFVDSCAGTSPSGFLRGTVVYR